MQSYTSTMNVQGRVVIPAPIRRVMGLEGPKDLVFRFDDGTLIVETIEAAVAEVQNAAAPYRVPGRSLVDELIADRRAEAAAE